MSQQPKAFTVTSRGGLMRDLKSPVGISAYAPDSKPAFEGKALWDTGATGTVMHPKIAQQLNLAPIDKKITTGVTGSTQSNVYLVDVFLPNGVCMSGVRVTEFGAHVKGFDVLIGMDIITQGDFALTNYKGNTTFSFRIPSIEKIDFVSKKPPAPVKTGPKVNRNAPCPCGSGKKYKQCCMNK